MPDVGTTPPPSVSSLLAKVRAAVGPRPHAELVVESYTHAGDDETIDRARIGSNVRTTVRNGAFTTSAGVFDGQRWHQNANGLTVLDEPPPGREATLRDVVTLAHVSSPISADVISILDAKGDGEKIFVDPATSQIVRSEEVSPTGIGVTTYDDFRTTDGRTQPWHERFGDGQSADISETTIRSIATSGIAPTAVAIAPPRRALVTFPPGVGTVRLPVTFDTEQHFLTRVTIGNRGMDFLVDTGGANGITIDDATARSLGLTLHGGYTRTAAGRYTEYDTVVPEMRVGPLTMTDVVVKVIPHLRFQSPGTPALAVGLLGFDFIASLALTFDYEHHTMTATDYDDFKPPSGPKVVALPIRIGHQGPEIDVSVDGRVGERFVLDTGGAGGLMISDYFTRRYPKITDSFVRRDQNIGLQGAGGNFTAPLYTVPSVRIGPIDFQQFTAIVVDSDRLYSSGGFDGIVGPAVLQYFDVTTDYADSTIYLTPNGRSDIRESF